MSVTESISISKTTESMVTVRLSDAEIPALPSPTPTLKLVDEKSEEFILGDKEPIFAPERTESPSPTEMTASRRSSTSSETAKEAQEGEGESENSVDWAGLEKTEGEQEKDRPQEGTAFLLARLEQENKRLEQDPKALHTHPERPPSLAKLRQMMDNPDPNTMRYSMLPSPPPLTDLDFYAAMVADYNKAASKLPNLLSKKIRGGVPPPLRGVVWIAMSGARDCNLEGLYEQLLGETSPYEQLIGKDIGRTGLEMFKQEGGEGQRMLGRVLRAFSIYDAQIGYCQGLGFLVGPLLMHMGEKETFCVLVRLMEHYDLRSCFLPNLYGLQLRMYQFTQLLAMHLPELSSHLTELGIQPTYASQWFLSFFAISCPLPMLFRIYDVIFAEGAPETIMRVAISLMRRNEKRLLGTSEFEDVMQMLLSRSLWDTYNYNADDLVQDFVGFSGIVTRDSLADLEKKFKETNSDDSVKLAPAKSQVPDLQAAASRFLGRLWGGPSQGSVSLSPISVASRRSSKVLIQRTPSKQSLSTVSSYETTDTTTTDATTMSICSSIAPDDRRASTRSILSMRKANNRDGELHGQIEDLLVALSTLQRENAAKMDEFRAFQVRRNEERDLTKRLVELLGNGSQNEEESVTEISDLCDEITERLDKAEEEEIIPTPKPATAQLAEDLQQTRDLLQREMLKSRNLSNSLAEQDADVVRLKSQLLDVRGKWQDIQKENQQLQKTISDLKQIRRSGSWDVPSSPGAENKGGLRELRLGRSDSARKAPQYSKRTSSLGMHSLLTSTENQAPAPEEQLLMELVAAKTAEAVAKQEAEEAKAKLEALRKVLTGSATAVTNVPPSPGLTSGFSFLTTPAASTTPSPSSATSTSSGGGWFSGGWGVKRAATNVDSR
ncbi:rab-GTPase-TBC domain-containing protein [Geopyxis carbonaria]|nr:rab-GTPase-TBC domain-containing protein [Geopyxis carbonaria]